MSAPRVLTLERLTTGYPGRVVGKELSLTLRSGEVLALLGPNGSGKTTLFRTLLGLTTRLGGRILLDGADIDGLGLGERARLFGYVPQASPGYFPYSVRDFVLMGRTPHIGALSGPSSGDREAAQAAIERIGIAALADRDITRISGGERQLALIARALTQEPAFLVMDEPTASLDFSNQLRILDLIRRLAVQGLGIVFSTHHPDQALAVATHAALLTKGKMLAAGRAEPVLSAENLSRLFGVPLTVDTVAGRKVCVPGAAPDGGNSRDA